MSKAKKLSTKAYFRAILGVAVLSFKTSPVTVMFKLAGIMVYAALPILVTYFAAQTISELTAAYGGDTEAGTRALWLVAITAGIGLLSTAWRSVDQYVQQLMRYKVEAKVGDMMYEHFLSLDYWRYDDKNTADLYDRAQKFTQFYAYVFDRISAILTQCITLIFAVTALLFVFPWLALFTLIAVVPGVFIQFKLSRAQIAHWNKNVEVRRTKNYIEYNLLQPNAIAELKLNGLIRHFMNLRQTMRDKDERYRLGFERKYISWRLLSDAVEAITELGALIWVVLQIIAREQPLGQFLYVQQMVSRALTSANSFVAELSNIDEDLANLFDYQEFMNLPTRSGGTIKMTDSPRTIQFNNVSFRYPQSRNKVLQDVSLTFNQGQHIAIVGENGAGKSTLVKLLAGLYKPISGTVTVDGTDLQELELGSWHRRLSLLQQDFQQYIFANIRDNVYFGDVSRPLNSQRVKESMQQAEAYDFVQALPQKSKTYPNTWMEDDEGNKGINLSGGQWQRLALARNFYRNASILVLDEPTSAIDALAEARVFDRLFARGNEKTVITVSHRLSTVEKADVIVVLDEGRVVETGTHKELAAKKGYYYRLFERQLADKV